MRDRNVRRSGLVLLGVPSDFISKGATVVSHWLGVTSTLVATATAIFTTSLAVSVNERNARDRFFEKQLQACTDLGDASIPLQTGLNELNAGFVLVSIGQQEAAKPILDRGQDMVDKAYDEYRKITARLFVLYPDSFVPLQGQIVKFTPTTLRSRAEAVPHPDAAFTTLHDSFTDADIKLRDACTTYLRGYAKTNLMDGGK